MSYRAISASGITTAKAVTWSNSGGPCECAFVQTRMFQTDEILLFLRPQFILSALLSGYENSR